MTSQTLDARRDLSVQETCSLLGVTPPTVYKLLGRGDLKGYLVGRSRRITAESVQRLRNGGKRGAA